MIKNPLALCSSLSSLPCFIVTNYSSQDSSIDVLEELRGVLLESDKYKTATIQSHSVGIELQGINIDVVPVIADPDDNELYYIGDSEDGSKPLKKSSKM